MVTWTDEKKAELRAVYGTLPTRKLAVMFGTTSSAIRHIASKWGFSQPVHYTVTQDFFDVINTPAKAYWLGVLFADGTLWKRRGKISNVSIEVIASDASHLELLRQDVGSNAPLTYRRNAVRLHLCGERFASPLSIMRPKETATPWMSVPSSLHFHFARGVFDGDGSINKAHQYTSRANVVGSFMLCEFLRDLFGCGTVAQIKPRGGGRLYEVRWHGKDAACVAHAFYGSGGPRLERKYQRFVDYDILPTKESVSGVT